MEEKLETELGQDKIEETIVEETNPKIDETTEDKTQKDDESESFNYEEYGNLGTAEELKEYLSELLPEGASKAEIEIAKKLLKKLNDDSKDDEVEEEPEVKEEEMKANREAVLDNLPISKNEFKDLQAWVGKQSEDYKTKIAELTSWKNDPESIRQAIIEANNERLNSVVGAKRIDTGAGSKEVPLTKEEVMKQYESIYMLNNGNERKQKINELKQKAMSNSKTSEWAKYFFE